MLKSIIDKQKKKIKKLSAEMKGMEEEHHQSLESIVNKANKYRKKYLDLKLERDEIIFDQEVEIESLKEEKEVELLKLKGRIYSLETIVEENINSDHEVLKEGGTSIEQEWNKVLQQNKNLKESLGIVKGTRNEMKRKFDELTDDFDLLNKEKEEYKTKYFNLKSNRNEENEEEMEENGNKKKETEENNNGNEKEIGTEEVTNEENPNTPKKMEQSTLTQTPGLIYNGSVITPGKKNKE